MHNYGHWKKTLALLVMSALSLGASSVDAMPEGGVVRSGSGSVTQNGKEMTIRQDSGRLAMDWTGFSVGKDETVRFQQPGKDALALNRVTGNQQSVIDGSLLSNGHVLLVNPNGVVIGKNASIDVGGLVASTAQVKDNFMKEFGNSTGAFSLGGVSDGKIINEGTIKAEGGLVALHAAKVENSGTISNTGGSAVLAAADTLTLTPDADGKLNFTVDGKAAEASALNKGAITADGGTIVMTADSASDVMSTVVNNSGTLQARTLRKNEKGQILLDGGDKGQVEVSGTLDASGTEEGQSAGNIKVIGEKTIVHDGTNLLAKGSMDGGKIETSGDVLNLGDNLNIDAKGVNGKAGEWLLDPLDVIIADSDPTTTSNYDKADKKTAADSDFTHGSASIGYYDPDATDANVSSVNSAVTWISTDMVENMLNANTNVTIQAAATNGSANIIVKDNIDKNAGGDATLTLDAMRNITINGNISSTYNKLNVVLNADSNGDKIGAVIINGNINTNGGDFTSASGGDVTYTSDEAKTKGYGKGTLKGKAEPAGHTVGTYFGHVNDDGTADGTKDDRLIQTKGGKITLNGEIAIGLNGGTLTLDSGGGAVTATGIINSGNSYGAYVYGTTTWDELTADKVNYYLTNDIVPAYHYQGVNYVKNPDGSYKTTTDTADFSDGEPHYTFDKETNTQNIRWLGDGSSTAVSTTKGKGYSSVIITEGKMSTKEYLQYVAVSDPAGFLSRYMTSNPTITVESKSYALTVGSVTVNRVSNNALGYKVGNKFTALTQQQIQSLADGALTLAKNSTDTTAMSNDLTAYTNLTNDIKRLIASNWFVSETLAKYDPKTKTYNNGKSAVEDSYLATITTVLENSLTTPNGQQILWAGGRGSGVLNKKGSTSSANDKLYPYSFYGMPDDPTYQDGMYWVTGPEGEANGGKGTQFYSNAGSDWGTVSLGSDGKTYTYNQGNNVYGYVNWDTWTDKATATDTKRVDVTRSQPDNSSPFLSVGYGTTGKWDDAAMGGATTVGFIKETNLANSSLNIKAGSGTVNLEGDLGKAKALDTVNIESTGAVTLGNPNNTATTYHNGTVYADHGVYISGGTISVGGEIHSGTTDKTASASTITTRSDGYQNTAFQLDSVTIKSAGDLTVHGVESDGYTGSDGNLKGGKISLTSTGKTGTITLGAGVDYNGNATEGTLAAASTAAGAVVVDAQGSQGSLVNSTTGKEAITTGTNGTWQVYVASPRDYDTKLGDNLNSKTNAQWSSESTRKSTTDESDKNAAGHNIGTYTDTSSNKFIFQVTPVITVSAGNYGKTYGDTLADNTWKKVNVSATYTASDGVTPVDVSEFSTNFQEDYVNYIENGSTKGLSNVTTSTNGAKATATRTKGDEVKADGTYKTANDKQRAFYNINVDYATGTTGANGYALGKKNGEIEITKRTARITATGNQVYGDKSISWTDPTNPKDNNIADRSKVTYDTSVKSGSAYTDNRKDRNTADSGTYKDSVSFDNLKIIDAEGHDVDIAANYDLTTTGTIDVAKAKLNINIDDTSATYGSSEWTPYTYKLDKLVNGDTSASITVGDWQNGGIRTDSADKDVKTQGVGGSYQLTGKFELTGDTAKNYEIGTVNPGKAIVNPKDIYIYAEGNGSTLGDVTWTKITRDDLVNGDSWDKGLFTFRVEPGDLISYADKIFGIKGYVNGQLVSDGTQICNYIYHPTGIVQLTFNPIVKPDVWAHSGGYRPRNKIETSLPVFRVEDAKVGQYGTYGVEHNEEEDKLVLSATGMRLPEPDQVPDEERTFTTTLSTETGSGTFKLVYNGVSLKIYPQDKEAEETVRAGDKTKNVSLSEKALYVGYTEMGLDLIDLKGVYIYFN
ncbi:filamentous hemagglutinin N-terminal domain-containing protein [uncultured Dialister sp.]|uniref:two-partner secretion domain-containing protein n=1 Tax=uncultured Dialister sp. TaxID=278064 RepID=UPI0025F4D086|nr:filamentous hemagglutinin N-terminal domain-containing protein [uncultured Dialister sp.]